MGVKPKVNVPVLIIATIVGGLLLAAVIAEMLPPYIIVVFLIVTVIGLVVLYKMEESGRRYEVIIRFSKFMYDSDDLFKEKFLKLTGEERKIIKEAYGDTPELVEQIKQAENEEKNWKKAKLVGVKEK